MPELFVNFPHYMILISNFLNYKDCISLFSTTKEIYRKFFNAFIAYFGPIHLVAKFLNHEDCLSLFSVTKEIHKKFFYPSTFDKWFSEKTEYNDFRDSIRISPDLKIATDVVEPLDPEYFSNILRHVNTKNALIFSTYHSFGVVVIKIAFKDPHNKKEIFLRNLEYIKLTAAFNSLVFYDRLTANIFNKFEEPEEFPNILIIHLNLTNDCIFPQTKYHQQFFQIKLSNLDFIDVGATRLFINYYLYDFPPYVMKVPLINCVKYNLELCKNESNEFCSIFRSESPLLSLLKSVMIIIDNNKLGDLEKIGIFYLCLENRKPSSYYEFSLSPQKKLSILDQVSNNVDPDKLQYKNQFWNLKIDKDSLSYLEKTCLVIEFPDLWKSENYYNHHQSTLGSWRKHHLYLKLVSQNPLKEIPDFYLLHKNRFYSNGEFGWCAL